MKSISILVFVLLADRKWYSAYLKARLQIQGLWSLSRLNAPNAGMGMSCIFLLRNTGLHNAHDAKATLRIAVVPLTRLRSILRITNTNSTPRGTLATDAFLSRFVVTQRGVRNPTEKRGTMDNRILKYSELAKAVDHCHRAMSELIAAYKVADNCDVNYGEHWDLLNGVEALRKQIDQKRREVRDELQSNRNEGL
jgi:hypothetical protein